MNKKKIICQVVLCVLICVLIQPVFASYTETGSEVKEKTFTYSKNNQQNLIQNQVTLTGNQKKLSTALLQLTYPSVMSESQTQEMVKSELVMKNSGKKMAFPELYIATAQEDLVQVYIYIKPEFSSHIIDLSVAEVLFRDESNHIVVAWVEIQKLDSIVAIDGVMSISEVVPPVVNIGSVTTAGDIIHKMADARSCSGYSGSGMKIGIISNGVNNIASSQASGDLSQVTVLDNSFGGDEGTAMLEIVHDMVPDAQLYFHTSGDSMPAMQSAIHDLADAGCTVICDDIAFKTDYYFENSPLASNLSSLLSSQNIVYAASAGNYAQRHFQGDYYSDGGTIYHDFSHGTTTSLKYLYVKLPPDSKVDIVLQWNDKWGQSANDYNLYLSEEKSGYIVGDLGKSETFQSTTKNPIERVFYTNNKSRTFDAIIDVSKRSGTTKTLEIYIFPSEGASVYSNNMVAADSIFGHLAVPNIISVAAAPSTASSTIEPFSSRGPVTITFPSPETRSKPDITGVDAVRVTGAGGFPKIFNGTSAAAPHIAAVVAHYWGSHPSKTPAEVRNTLYSSAQDLGVSGKDTTFGYGLADALTMQGACGTSPIGVFRPSTHLFYLKNGATTAINWGTSTDLPVTGDWNGDGKTDVGVFRPSNHMFYLKNGTTTAINWGISTDLPVTGDWNKDGRTEVGVYRPSTHTFYLKNGTTTTSVNWGVSTDLPVTGDWNGDGRTDVGVYRPSAHTFYLKNGATTTSVNWGASTDLPVTGKW